MSATSKILNRIYRVQKNEKKTSYLLQLLDHYSTILGAFVSIILSCIAIYLSIQQAKTDRSVEKLTNIVARLDSLRDKNEQIIIVLLEQQNELLKQSQELKKQTAISTKSLEIEKSDYSNKSNKELELLIRLREDFITQSDKIIDNRSNFLSYPAPIKDEILTSICNTLDRIKLNAIALNDTEMSRKIEAINSQKSDIINGRDQSVHQTFKDNIISIRKLLQKY